jgi:hypothetical protein
MAKATPIQTSFNAGEWSPELEGRVDLDKHGNSCFRMENSLPLVQGPARRRGGTRFVNEVKTSANQTWLLPFEFSAEQAYVLEFGNLYVRFYTNHGLVESSPGVPLEVATPYTTANLKNADGTLALNFVQSGDVLYITHPSHQPRKLQRFSALSFTMALFEPDGGPFKDVDPDQAITIYASAQTGSVTLTASAALFAASDVGRTFLLEQKAVDIVNQWEPGKTITAGALRRSDGKNYLANNSATTGAVRPVHTEGARYDGDGGVQWAFQNAGYGTLTITGFTSSTVVTATVLDQVPTGAVGSGNASNRWAFGAWSNTDGWPSHTTFFRERLCFARSADQLIWFSVAGDFEDFSAKDAGGQIVKDQAISIRIDSDKVDNVKWLSPGDSLIVGTAGAEHSIREITTSEAFGPGNVKISKQSDYGSNGAIPAKVGSTILFVQKSARKLRSYLYDFNSDTFQGNNMSALAPHFFRRRQAILQVAYQQEPYSIVWAVRNDGLLLGFTFDQEQSVTAWHRHQLGGTGVVESIVSIPSPNGDRDDLWLIVKRTISGVTKRYVEWMEEEWDSSQPQNEAFYVDSGLSYNGAPATVISGGSHLNGTTVDILADGATHPQKVMIGGSVTLDRAASVVHLGLPCPAKVATMRLEAGAADGTAQGKIKRITHATLRFMDTLGGKAGPSETKLQEILFREAADPMDSPPAVFTGDKRVGWPGGYEKEGRLWYVNDQPLPFTLVAIIPEVNTQDR